MKKVIYVLFFVLGATQFSQAQVDFGIKAGINYNSDSFVDVKDDILESDAKSKTGFHAGIWTRFNIPVIGLYLRPELVYTSLKSELNSEGESFADYDFQKIDVPILIGKKFLKVAHFYAGPSFQYIINGDLDIKNFSDLQSAVETEVDGLTVGFQVGAGLEISKIGLDVRWERGFSDTASKLISDNIENNNFEFDTRINQIIVSLSYKF